MKVKLLFHQRYSQHPERELPEVLAVTDEDDEQTPLADYSSSKAGSSKKQPASSW